MTVKKVKEIARKWVEEEGSIVPGFQGAFFGGSVNWKPENEPFPSHSDLDISVVVDGDTNYFKRKKLLYHDVILDPSIKQIEQVQTPEQVLAQLRQK